jgi:phosphoglucosamine mutase
MSKRELFGTDGVRGQANKWPMTCEMALSLGRAVVHYFQSKHDRQGPPLIVIGKDTRLSCYMLEQAFSAGVLSQGGRVIFTGPLPTPGIAFVTESMRACAGVMISASHNHFSDNGIKIFDNHGHKLPDEVELKLEEMVLNPELIPSKSGEELGRAKRLEEVFGRYIVHIKATFEKGYDLSGMRIVLDCANGAGYKIAPLVLEELGAEVITLGVNPDGTNINHECGSLHPYGAQEAVKKYRADLGICLDGDGDRVVIIDEKGEIVDGDSLIGLFARVMLEKGELKQRDPVVGTVMTNLGLENYLKKMGLDFIRTPVGDRYILSELKAREGLLGGEPSGHIIFYQHSKTGDGIVAALKAVEAMKHFGGRLSSVVKDVSLYPQILKNVPVSQKIPFENVPEIMDAQAETEKKMGTKGRVLLRYSGTENLCRVMVEGEDQELVEECVNYLSDKVQSALRS